MIELHRLNGAVIVINAELVESLEPTPDTVVTLTTGRRIMVAEPVHDVIDRIVAYHRAVLHPAVGMEFQSGVGNAEWGVRNAE